MQYKYTATFNVKISLSYAQCTCRISHISFVAYISNISLLQSIYQRYWFSDFLMLAVSVRNSLHCIKSCKESNTKCHAQVHVIVSTSTYLDAITCSCAQEDVIGIGGVSISLRDVFCDVFTNHSYPCTVTVSPWELTKIQCRYIINYGHCLILFS